MATHSFTFTLTISGIGYDDAEPRLAETCADATLSQSYGVMLLDFDREAADIWSAVNAAIDDITRAGAIVRHVEPLR